MTASRLIVTVLIAVVLIFLISLLFLAVGSG
jgi:hypothetical protein